MRGLVIACVTLLALGACAGEDDAKARMEAERKAAVERAKKLEAVTRPDPEAAKPGPVKSKAQLVDDCGDDDGAACQGACALGDAESCVKLGTMFEEARGGVPENFESARVFHLRGCELGAGSGCYALALFYKLGKSIPKSPRRAKRFFDKGCKLGFEAACLELENPAR